VAVLLLQLYRQSSDALVGRGEAALHQACDRIEDRYAYYITDWLGPLPPAGDTALQEDLDGVAELGLLDSPGIDGGIIRDPAATLPATPQIQIAAEALAAGGTMLDTSTIGTRTIIMLGCPLRGPVPNLAAWVETEVEAAPGYSALQIGLGVLMALVLSLTAGLTWFVTAWGRQVGRMEAALAAHDSTDLPRIGPTGEAELDRIARALNTAGERLSAARQAAEAALERAALAERMAALGRVAAGVAHEIRTPIASMRLRAEGALAVDPALEPDRAATRGRAALGAILGQINRLDRLSGELLTMTQRRVPVLETVDLAAFLSDYAAEWPGVRLEVGPDAGPVRFDREMLRRVLDNLIQNALRHIPAGGEIVLRGALQPASLHIEVEDSGPGVPAALRDTLFEPFVTSRADGTGLGLSIAREIVQAHGGRIWLARAEPGAVLAFEIPQEPAT